MYQAHIYFHLKATSDKESILKMFFQDWTDDICNQEVSYSTVSTGRGSRAWWNEIIRVDFSNAEDAVALRLRGIPEEFKEYLEILDYPG